MKYVKMNPREHVLARPGMYIGSTEVDKVSAWVISNGSNAAMEKKEVNYIPGLFKIFDEILVNVMDHMVRLKEQNECEKKVTKLFYCSIIYQYKFEVKSRKI